MQAQNATSSERLSGVIERVTFHSEETGFCVLRVKVRGHRDLITVVGTAATVTAGEHVECEGGWVQDRNHGLQFKATHLRVIPPSTLEGIEKYLGSGMVKGIGPHFAKKLVATFGKAVFEVIEREPERLTELAGIGPKRKEQITDAWAEQKGVRDIMVFLQSHGVGTARAVRIYRNYGDKAIELVRENPYRLALDIHGIGFKTADTIAERLDIPRDAIMRAQAGLRHVLLKFSNEGHCAARREDLIDTAAKLLEIPTASLEQAIAFELKEGHLMLEEIGGEPYLYLASLHQAEVGVASSLARLMRGIPRWGLIDPDKAIPWVEKNISLILSPSQREAFARVINAKVAVITGGPGVGKTTVVNSLLMAVRAKGARVQLCAPTGRAAKRLSESTGMESKTIHRLLELEPSGAGFKRGVHNPLGADLICIDEVSMVDVILMNQLLRAVSETASVWLVGDADQLPSVGPGAVLSDIIASGQIPVARLTEIHRQAADSSIIANAHQVNRGRMPRMPERLDHEGESDFYFIPAETPEEVHDKLLHVVTERIPKRFGFDPIQEVQVLVPMNRGPLGARALNAELQHRLNPTAQPQVERFGWCFAPGDKVIQTVNNYHKEVFNGDIGRVSWVDLEEGVLYIDYDGREVEYDFGELDELCLAYAVTVHKSQGSEYPAVVIPLVTQHYTLLQRNLLYTAVTRGKQLVVIIGQPQALAIAVRNTKSARRLTHLARRLQMAGCELSLNSR